MDSGSRKRNIIERFLNLKLRQGENIYAGTAEQRNRGAGLC